MTKYDIFPVKTLTFWDKLISRKMIKLGMDKKGFRDFFSFVFSYFTLISLYKSFPFWRTWVIYTTISKFLSYYVLETFFEVQDVFTSMTE